MFTDFLKLLRSWSTVHAALSGDGSWMSAVLLRVAD